MAGRIPTRKKVAVLIIGHGLYGREVAQGILQYSLGHTDWEIHYEGVADPTAVQRIAAAISDWPADGAILQTLDSHLAAALDERKVPAVLFSGQTDDRAATVCPDNYAVGSAVADYFIGRGIRSLAYCGVLGESFSDLRERGFVATARTANIVPAMLQYRYLARKSRDWISDYQEMTAWMLELPKPTGLMACNDGIARDVVAMCRRLGIRVPDDIAVVGVDNDNVECSMSQVPLSSVKLPVTEIGFRAAETLDKMMTGERRHPQPLCLPPTMVVTRQSSDVYMVQHPDLRAVLRFIREHASEPISVGDIVRAVPVSRRWLEKQFLTTFGHTIRHEMLRIHAEHAKRLLMETDLKIATIGLRSGYSKYQVFPRLFKQSTGMLPSEFRRRFGTAASLSANHDDKG